MCKSLEMQQEEKKALKIQSVFLLHFLLYFLLNRVNGSYRPLLSVDEDLTAGDVHSIPRQC